MNEKLLSKAQQNLQHYWGFESFRSGQDEAIQSILTGDDTLVLFPTGGGKSLCYQIPATLFEGLTLVISPLIALMQDQVQQLNEKGIAATFVNSSLPMYEVEQRLVNARNGMYDLLYCAPERLSTSRWEGELPNMNIDLVAIDEAHCISEWGHDFRPSYREIRPALEPISNSVRWMALTATATPEVRDDIIRNLQFKNPAVISKGFQRENLKWWVVKGAKKDRNLLRSVTKAAPQGSGIVYGGTRKNCERLSQNIQKKVGIKTAAYHAGLEAAKRKKIQEQWVRGEVPLVVATNAFGMGIDKADCRYVIHYEMPYSLEAYYQQAGRAGRDGVESFPLLLFKPADAHRAAQRIKDSYPEKEQLQKVYDALCDTLNLAVGSEEEEMREISIESLKKRTHFAERTVRAALNTLSNLGVVEMTDYFFPKIGIRFVVNPDYLRDQIVKEKNQRKAEFMDVLFRQYGGEAFSEMKYVDLSYVEEKLNTNKNGVIKGLQVLQNYDQILLFEALGELPLIRPVEPRMRALNLSRQQLERNRDTLLKKLEYMIGYINTDGCREVYIRTYFGEENVQPCGHCDNCLNGGGEIFEMPSSEDLINLKKLLDREAMDLHAIKKKSQWNGDKIEKIISYLRRENRLKLEDGKYHWVK